jgi:hypothetical protein
MKTQQNSHDHVLSELGWASVWVLVDRSKCEILRDPVGLKMPLPGQLSQSSTPCQNELDPLTKVQARYLGTN